MKVKLTENQLQKCIIMEFVGNLASKRNNYNPIADGNSEHNPYSKQIKSSIELIQRFLANNSRIMTNVDNGKDYLVFEITQLAQLTGKRFCLCQLYKDNKPFGAIYVKPFLMFKEKIR